MLVSDVFKKNVVEDTGDWECVAEHFGKGGKSRKALLKK